MFHALREFIANALDEQVLTQSKEIRIEYEAEGTWRIRDYGRGLQYMHFTQNENQEKLSHPNLIGRFEVGLRDAMATFDRHDVGVEILSRRRNIFSFYSVGRKSCLRYNTVKSSRNMRTR